MIDTSSPKGPPKLASAGRIKIISQGTPDPRLIALKAENEKLREALRAIEEGRIARPLGAAYRADGVASKNDLCVHNVYMYQACESCIDAHIQAALETK